MERRRIGMAKLDIRRRKMLECVREFGAARRDLFPAPSFAGRMFAAVAHALEALQQHELAKLKAHESERHHAASKARARIALRRRLGLMSRMARIVAFDQPGFEKKLRIRVDCSDDLLLSRARSFVKAARPLARAFAAHDMPPTFLTAIEEDIAAFEHAISSREDSRGHHATTRSSIDGEVRKAMQAVKRLDVVLHTLEDPRLLARWNEARRIGYPPRTRKPAA
jgi:hypothetical protein